MPRRNLVLILLVVVLSLTFHVKAREQRYAGRISEAMSLVKQRYYQDVDEKELFDSAMKGMVAKLDENSRYLTAKEYNDLMEGTLDRRIHGIGVLLDGQAKEFTVLAPVPGSPAAKQGIEPGDVIEKIDGHPTADMERDEAIDLIKGPIGTTVTLTIRRESPRRVLPITIERAEIVSDSVVGESHHADGTWDFSIHGAPRIKYLKVESFAKQTAEELRSRLKQLDRQGGIDALVLDLRDNTGGLLDAAVEICGMFIDRGQTVVTIRSRRAEIRELHKSSGEKIGGDYPMVVLINGLSASASEITAACLQDHGRAAIVGSQSFGKGTVQEVIPLDAKGAHLKLTTATYWRPSNQPIHRTKDNQDDKSAWGVRPDAGLEVVLSREQQMKIAIAWLAIERDVRRVKRPKGGSAAPMAPEPDVVLPTMLSVDPQLQRAVQYLQAKLNPREHYLPTMAEKDENAAKRPSAAANPAVPVKDKAEAEKAGAE
jgi:carboxyl-terminal processing protease